MLKDDRKEQPSTRKLILSISVRLSSRKKSHCQWKMKMIDHQATFNQDTMAFLSRVLAAVELRRRGAMK